MKKKLLAALLAILLSLSSAWADVNVPAEFRIKNQSPGYCMWASLETIGRTLGVKQTEGLVEARKQDGPWGIRDQQTGVYEWFPNNIGHPVIVKLKLQDRGVKFKMQEPGVKDLAIIKEALKANRPVAIGIMMDVPVGSHAVALTSLDEKEVHYVDSNYPGVISVRTRAWFDERWTGYVVDLWP